MSLNATSSKLTNPYLTFQNSHGSKRAAMALRMFVDTFIDLFLNNPDGISVLLSEGFIGGFSTSFSRLFSVLSFHPTSLSSSSLSFYHHSTRDKRIPGLFKNEYCGDGFSGLCEEGNDKVSSKGLNKANVSKTL